jgi:hypothetical protein
MRSKFSPGVGKSSPWEGGPSSERGSNEQREQEGRGPETRCREVRNYSCPEKAMSFVKPHNPEKKLLEHTVSRCWGRSFS